MLSAYCNVYIICLICSNFSDVFDEDYFINTLANDVKIVKKLPKDLSNATRAVKHFRSWSGVDYYQDEIASMWGEYKVYDQIVVLYRFLEGRGQLCYTCLLLA